MAGTNAITSDRPPAFFLADHLALDFLNTTAKPRGTLVDWLADGSDLIAWLRQAEAIDSAAEAKSKDWGSDVLDEVARQAREFRDWLRRFVTMHMGEPLRVAAGAIAPLNELLAKGDSFQRLEAAGGNAGKGGRLVLRRVRRWENPRELLVPIAEAAADLICNQDFRLIRSCEGSACILVFLDCTKAHARRWCSMAVCGNRAKAAAHRARRAGKEKRA